MALDVVGGALRVVGTKWPGELAQKVKADPSPANGAGSG